MTASEQVYITSAAAASARTNERLKGILFLCGGAFIFTFQDVIIKLVSGRYPLSEVLAIRCVVAIAPLLLLVHLDGGLSGLRSRRPVLLLLRAGLLLVCYSCYYLAIAAIPLAEAVSLYFSAPFFIVTLSVPLLHERVRVSRWLAVIVGFLGVLAVLRPDAGAINPAMLLAVGAAMFYGLAQVMARRLGVTERASVMASYQNVLFFLAAVAAGIATGGASYEGHHASLEFLLRPWTMPDAVDLTFIGATGLVAALGSFCLTHAYRVAEANIVAPFEFTAIIWGTLSQLLVWGDVPHLSTIAGVLLIAAAGVYVLRSTR